MKTPILQFGTSRFLQAHVDLFVSEALAKGDALGPITVVQTSGDPQRARRIAALADRHGFPVCIRGLEEGRVIDRELRVKSVTRALSTATQWDDVARVFVEEAEVIVSNTGDSGYVVSPGDALSGVPKSFPMKLLKLLALRYRNGGKPLTVLPCELLSRNGDKLKALIHDLSRRFVPDEGFDAWLSTSVIFANTLVDRIVSAPLEPAGAIAEPYALWVIENRTGLTMPCRHPSIHLVEDLTPHEKLKLHILNLGHTVLADHWLKEARRIDETVREMLASAPVRDMLLQLYREEVIPGFALHGMEQAAVSYLEQTMARFENPFLDHALKDIAGNHREKIERRIAAFLRWCPGIVMPRLEQIAAGA
ncbi:mannitol dehydrogenase family protein [Peteryoungia desertarenae]|uniref:Mannitol dehydrogenase family protein n=1 Tax=Peteryoungia desertarenae TaxID=1813451 RepID=A0ABX6QJK4_9HYPH|nr:mannitol dehydrogenase family protein [Peteryoungia desertarenae]QLF68736.1 mannitol dehydrogenase family protein [Peteryoungia desertarenae]